MNLRQSCSTVVVVLLMAILVAPAQGTPFTIESVSASGTALDAAGTIPTTDYSSYPPWDPAAPQWIFAPSEVPEPATVILVGVGMLLLGVLGKKRRANR